MVRATRVITSKSYEIRSSEVLTEVGWQRLVNRMKMKKVTFMCNVYMPPKNKKKSNLSVDSGSPTNESEKVGIELAGVSPELEHFLDQRLNQQSEKIDALLSK